MMYEPLEEFIYTSEILTIFEKIPEISFEILAITSIPSFELDICLLSGHAVGDSLGANDGANEGARDGAFDGE